MVGLYVHIPFCIRKCKYCDFVSFDCSDSLKGSYIDMLETEAEKYRGIEVDTVFVGGGTPTSLEVEELEKLLKIIKCNFIINNAEFTVEANPKTLTEKKLKILKTYGVNRISVGVQSFDDDELLRIGRIHDAKNAFETIELIKKCGFENISIDLMSALPSQSFESFSKSLKTAVLCKPSHISCYSLILEEGTPLFLEYEKGNLDLPDEDTERKMYEYACDYLESEGYKQYEISNFAKEGMESLHNIKYWECREYIGLGIAAHSYYKGIRYSNTNDLSQYLNGKFSSGEKSVLTLEDKIEEFMIMGLRMTRGVSKDEFYKRFGLRIENVYKNEISKFIDYGFLIENDGFLRLSREGISVSNSILCEFSICNLKKDD